MHSFNVTLKKVKSLRFLLDHIRQLTKNLSNLSKILNFILFSFVNTIVLIIKVSRYYEFTKENFRAREHRRGFGIEYGKSHMLELTRSVR